MSAWSLLSDYAVVVGGTASTAAATAAIATWLKVRDLERDFYGAGEIDHDRGIAGEVAENKQRSEQNRKALRREGLISGRHRDD